LVEIQLVVMERTRPRVIIDGGVGGHGAVEVPDTVRGGSRHGGWRCRRRREAGLEVDFNLGSGFWESPTPPESDAISIEEFRVRGPRG
jgi:hypothetical protein